MELNVIDFRFKLRAALRWLGRDVYTIVLTRTRRMLKVKDYFSHAEECRRLASITDNSKHREALLQMSLTWADLAVTRADTIRRKKRIKELVGDNTPRAAGPTRRV